MRRRPTGGIRLAALAGGCGLLALLIAQLGPVHILGLLATLNGNILVIAALFACHECVRARAVGLCFPDGQRPPFHALLRVRLLGEAVGALTRTGPFGAEPTRAWMLAGQAGVGGLYAYGAAASELIANSCTSAMVTVVVAGIGLRAGGLHGPLLVLAHVLLWSSLVYVSVAIGALAARAYVIGGVLRRLARLPLAGRWLKTNPVRVRSMEDAIIHALTGRPAVLGQVLLLECAAQALLIVEIYWTIRSMGVAITAANAPFVEVVTKVANVFQFVGVTEAGYAVLFNWLGLTAAVGFTLSVVKLMRSVLTAGLGLAILSALNRLGLTLAAATSLPGTGR